MTLSEGLKAGVSTTAKSLLLVAIASATGCGGGELPNGRPIKFGDDAASNIEYVAIDDYTESCGMRVSAATMSDEDSSYA